MKSAVRRLVVCAVVVGIAAVLHGILAGKLASGDTVGQLLSGPAIVTFLRLIALVVLRGFLLVLAPGWVLYSAVLLGHAVVVRRRGVL